MNQEPLRPPQVLPEQHLYGQQEWKQHLLSSQLSIYNHLSQEASEEVQQPQSHNVPLPKKRSGLWHWYMSRTKLVKLFIGCSVILALVIIFYCIRTSVGRVNSDTQALLTPLVAQQAEMLLTPKIPTLPTPGPTHPSSLNPAIAAIVTTTPQPQHTPTPCPGVNCNPWGYNFSPGNYIYSPPANFCDYFTCTNHFFYEYGYIVECKDGKYSKSWEDHKACFHDGGVLRPLYSH